MNVYSDYRLGELSLPNRFVMSPMTRSRALAGNVPNPLAAIYYAQRATAGLLITEGTQVSPQTFARPACIQPNRWPAGRSCASRAPG